MQPINEGNVNLFFLLELFFRCDSSHLLPSVFKKSGFAELSAVMLSGPGR